MSRIFSASYRSLTAPRLCSALSKPDWDKGRCYLATNQEKYRTAYLLDQIGFGRQFDGIFSSAYVGYVKHDTAFFEHVLRELKNVKVQEMLFWDDQPGNVATARAMGLHAELYSDFADFEKRMSSYLNES